MAKQAQQRSDLEHDRSDPVSLESALLQLATDFINLPVHETDSGIVRILEFVATFAGADCCGVSEFDREANQLYDVYTWTRPGTPSRGEAMSSVDMTDMVALFGNATEPSLVVDTLTDPRIPKGFGEAFAAFGIRSIAWYPISSDDREIVAIGVTSGRSTQWDTDQVSLLNAAGKLIANLRERTKTTADLEETTLLFKELSQSIDQNFFIWEADPPRLVYSNDAIETIFGVRAEQFSEDTQSFPDIVLPEYRESFTAMFREGRDTPQELEYRIRHTDGSIRWVRTRLFPIDHAGRPGVRIAGLTEDITQRVNITDTGVRLKQFERLLSQISSRFVETPLGEMDSPLGEALATVSTFANVEHSRIYLFDRNRQTMDEIAHWHTDRPESASEDLQTMSISSLPFFAGEILARRTITLSSVEDLSESATAERAFMNRHATRSCVLIPLVSAGDVIGALQLATESHQHVWSIEEASILRVWGDVVAAGLTRREAERQQQEGIHFERLVTSLVSEFMNLPAGELYVGIDRALGQIARFVNCDRSAIFMLDDSGDGADLVREWWAPGSAPVVDNYTRVDTPADSLYGEWIRSDEPHLALNANSIESFRPDAARAMREKQLGAVANLPLVIDGQRVGWFAVGAKLPRVNWSSSELRSLAVAADALANMFSRWRSEENRQRHQQFDDTLSEFAADFIKRPIAEIRTGIEEIVDGFGRFASCDRAAVLLLDNGGKTASTYHEWVVRGTPDPVEHFPIGEAPWFYNQLLTSTGPWIMHRAEFPPSDENAGIALDFIGIQTLLNCPIADGEHLFGYASIGYSEAHHRPSPGTEQVMGVAAGIIANALARERLEHDAAKQHEALAHALRLGSMGQLATGIAHELNQPLTAIANYSRACVRRIATSGVEKAELSDILDRVSDEAIRAGGIIHNLRNHVKRGRSQRKRTLLDDIIDHAVSLLAGTARENKVHIIVNREDESPNVRVDATEIEQVVINLVQNAIDSIASADCETREVHISTSRNRSFVDVEISDTGSGFSSDEAEKLFDQFHTTKPAGLGLGLSISRHLIESNGGTIEATASTRTGATFQFSLPVARATRTRKIASTNDD